MIHPLKKNSGLPYSKQVVRIMEDVSTLEKWVKESREYLEDIREKADREPYCYVNRFYRLSLEEGKQLYFKVIGVQGRGILPELVPMSYSPEDGEARKYREPINLDKVREATEITSEEYYEFHRRTGW